MSQEIRYEWDQHQSGFARRWRLSMVAKKKVEFVSSPQDTPLRQRLMQFVDHARDQAEIEKDRHLVETALRADRCILSLDEKARAYLRELAGEHPELKTLAWANPVNAT